MPAILRRLPVPSKPVYLTVQGATVRIKPHQIPVWVSLTPRELPEWDPKAPKFLALLDTAHNHYFALQQRHLQEWGGIWAQGSRPLGHIAVNRRRIPLLEADLWIHPNVPGQLVPSGQAPFRLFLKDGLAVYPDDGSNHPRLLLVGLRAILDNQLHLAVSGWRRAVTLRTRRWWWFWD